MSTEFLYKFLINNNFVGPYGINLAIDKLEIGDIIQLRFEKVNFTHTLIVVETGNSVRDTLNQSSNYITEKRNII